MYAHHPIANQEVFWVITIPQNQLIARQSEVITNWHLPKRIKKSLETIHYIGIDSFFTLYTTVGIGSPNLTIISYCP
jgi:hypothetical protein